MATTLIVPGLHGSGPEHWQHWFAQRIPGACCVDQDDWEDARLERWAGKVRQAIDRSPGKLWLVAHSFGCLASVLAASERRERIAGLMLVAPADPAKFGVAGWMPVRPLELPSVVVASTNDPWVGVLTAGYWANLWGSRFVNIGPAGHINIESGFGPWPEGLRLFQALQQVSSDLPSGTIPPDVDLTPAAF